MYIPKHFEVIDQDEIYDFIEKNSFGQLSSQVNGRLFSTHLPLLLSEDKKTLVCHVARQNPQWQEIEGQEVLTTLQGPHAYISPSWYEGAGVPTWNYQAVHIYGQARVFDDATRLKALVDGLTQKYESLQAQPWVPVYSPAMLSVIVGIEVSISEIQCKYKLSQNKSIDDQNRVSEQLDQAGAEQLANAIRKQESW